MTDILTRPPLLHGIPAITLTDMDRLACPLGHVILPESLIIGPEGGAFCPRCISPPRGERRKREAGATECIHGHDVTEPNALTSDGKCRKCRQVRARVYKQRAKLRPPKPPKVAELQVPSPDPLPLFKVMGSWVYAAACGPDTAFLFDKRQQGEDPEDALQRHLVARKLCEGCPVLFDCREWYCSEPADTPTVAALA